MAAKGVELASAYVSLSVSTDGIPAQVEKAFGASGSAAEKSGKDVGAKFNRGANSTIGKGLSESLAKELGSAGDRGSKEMLRSLASGYRDAERNVQVVGKRYAQALQSSMNGGGRDAAVKWEAEFKKALTARDSSKTFFDEFQRTSSARGERIGTAVGTVVGKSLGAAISVGITGAAGLATAAVGGLSYSLFKGFDRYKSLDATNRRLRAMGKSGEQVRGIIADINDVVEGTPISLDSAAASATQFLAGGIKQGEELNGVLTSIADAAGFSGQSFDDLAIIFGQVMNKGKLQAEEMLQLNERNIPIQQWLQKELGVTGSQLQKMSQDGQISFQNLVDAVEKNAPGMAKALGDTVDGALSNMKAAAARVGANIFAAIFGDPLSTDSGPGGMAKSINSVTERLKELNAWVANNGDVIVEWIANTAKGMTYLAESITVIVAGTTRGLAILANAFGDTLGGMTRAVAAVNRVLGRTEIADQLDAQADSMFGMADGIYRASDEALNLAHSIGDLRPQIDAWKDSTQQAALFTKSLGDAAKKIAPQNWWGTTIIKAPTADEIEKIKQAGFEVKAIPGTKDIEIIPVTDNATAQMNAWRQKQGAQPITPPVQPDLTTANTAMQAFINQWSSAIINPQVQVPGGGVPGSNPMDIFAPTGSGGLLGGGGNASAPGPGALPSSIGGGGGRPGGPTAGFPNAAGALGPGRLFGTAGNNANPTTSASADKRLTPETQAIQGYLRNTLGFKGTIGGWRPPDGFNEHSSGKASDVMVGSAAEGNALLPKLLAQPGVQYILWQQKTWYPDGSVKGMEDRGSPTKNHMDHLHVKTYDTGGWLPPGITPVHNATGQDELILNPEQQKMLQEQGIDPNALLQGQVDPNTTQHGQAQGAPPGPQPNPSNRTGGYIPATAGNTNPVGQGGLSSILGLGESFVNNLIDTGAQAASMAATAAAGAASFGAGAAAGPAASTAISMGAEAAKRGVQWGFDMAGIWGEALPEIFMPFGVPRWLGQVDPMAFVPQTPGQQPGQQPGGGAAAQSIQSWAQPGNPAMANGTAHEGAQAALDVAHQQPSYQAAAPATSPTPPPQQQNMNPLDPTTWLHFGGVFDQGGMLQPNSIGVNLSNRPEAVFTQQQLADMQKASASTQRSGNGDIYNFTSQDVEGMFREYMKSRRRESRQYSGRP